MFQCRSYAKADYPMVREWWNAHGTPAAPENILPACGLVAEEDDNAVAAAWLYFDNSVGVAWLAWIVTRPCMPARSVDQALKFLLGGAEVAARAQNRSVLITACRPRSLSRWLQRQGFQLNHGGVFDLFKFLT